jgi:hypothetical protein
LYVSEGVAGAHPARYGCPPEVTRFVLRPAPAGLLDREGMTAHGRGRLARQRDWAQC